jgi:hypothetical protein
MILDIVGATASWTDNKLHVAFDVVPEDHSHLGLNTGEIFQSDSYAALHKQQDKAISATLFVTRQERNAAGAELPSEMRYLPAAYERDSQISLVWRLPDEYLAGFHSLILAGRTPRKAVVFFPHHAELGYGWEPDGSGQKWDNKKSLAVPIENVSFNFNLEVPSADHLWNTEIPEGNDRAFFSDAAMVNFALVRKLSSIESKLSSIESLLGRVSWMVGLIALLVLGLALSHFWH